MLGGLGWGAQRYQEHIASNLVTQVHAQPILFADPLNMDSGNWPIEQARDNTYQEHYYFEGGAYHMQGVASDRIMYAWGSPNYANVAVEATVSEYGSDPDDGIGLLLRADESGDKYVAFMVDKTDDWYLLDFTYKSGNSDDNWSTIAGSDDDRAVHSGEGATNRLLVIIRGNRFTCFVNDQLVGSFAVSSVPVVGHMGVYSNASDVEGVYTNFVVYPAPPVPIPFA